MKNPCTSALRWSLACLAFGLLLAAQPRPTSAAPEGPRVELRRIDGPAVSGKLLALDAESVRLEVTPGRPAQAFALDQVIDLRFPPAEAAPRRESRLRAHLTGGDALLGRLLGPSEDGIRLSVRGLGEVDVSFDALLTLETVPAEAGPCHRPADGHPRAESGDIAYDARGDEFRGTVLEATQEALIMDSTRGRRRAVPWETLRVLQLENDPIQPAEGLQGELELSDGSRVTLAGVPKIAETGLVVASRSLPGATFAVPFSEVRVLRWWGGRFVYATTLPLESKLEWYYPGPEGHIEQLERWLGMRVNQRASGCPLRLGGVVYRHGFGVNSRTTIQITLGGDYRTFRALLGIDDEVLQEAREDGWRGDVDARVLGDGKVLWEAKGVQGGQKPRRVGPLDVSGVQKLVLEVGFGRDDLRNFLDRADWVEPILERK